jgi:hypothetical protein
VGGGARGQIISQKVIDKKLVPCTTSIPDNSCCARNSLIRIDSESILSGSKALVRNLCEYKPNTK